LSVEFKVRALAVAQSFIFLSELLMNPVVTSHYRPELVAASFALAFIGSMIALMITRDIRKKDGTISLFAAVTSGVALGGIGVWAMHFVGMVALHLDVASSYGLVETYVSLIAATVSTSAALVYVSKAPQEKSRLLIGGLLLGLAVAVMHFMGMYGMKIGGYINWDGAIIAASILIAVVAATAALWLAFNTKRLVSRTGAALVMAFAVCAMHYTGMQAAEFVCTTPDRFVTVKGWGLMTSYSMGPMVIVVSLGMAMLIALDLYLQSMQRSMERSRAKQF
jgi:NO-binding membrane sensor protein with MHYT domain